MFEVDLIDIKMPRMNGYDLYDKIKKIDSKVKSCFISAYEINYQALREKKDPTRRRTRFGLKDFMEGATSDLNYEVPNYKLEQGIECDTFTLAGNQACSILYSRTLDYMSEFEFAVMQVSTVEGNNAYMLTYMATVNDFDQYLPLANQMIASFQILDSSG